MNLNQIEVILALRICLNKKWSKKSDEFVIIVCGLPVGYRQKEPIPKQYKTMIAHVAHNFASNIKF